MCVCVHTHADTIVTIRLRARKNPEEEGLLREGWRGLCPWQHGCPCLSAKHAIEGVSASSFCPLTLGARKIIEQSHSHPQALSSGSARLPLLTVESRSRLHPPSQSEDLLSQHRQLPVWPWWCEAPWLGNKLVWDCLASSTRQWAGLSAFAVFLDAEGACSASYQARRQMTGLQSSTPQLRLLIHN